MKLVLLPFYNYCQFLIDLLNLLGNYGGSNMESMSYSNSCRIRTGKHYHNHLKEVEMESYIEILGGLILNSCLFNWHQEMLSRELKDLPYLARYLHCEKIQ